MGFRYLHLLCVEEIEIYAQGNGNSLRHAFKVTLGEGCFEREIIRAIVRTFVSFVCAGNENSELAYSGHKVVTSERAIIFYRTGRWPEKHYLCFVKLMEVLAAHYSWHFSCIKKVPDAHPMGAVQK